LCIRFLIIKRRTKIRLFSCYIIKTGLKCSNNVNIKGVIYLYESRHNGQQIDDSIQKVRDVTMVATQINSTLSFSDSLKFNLLALNNDEILCKKLDGSINGIGLTKNDLVIKGDILGDISYLVGTGGVLKGSVVFLTPANTVMLANSNNITHADRVVGLSLVNADENSMQLVRLTGTITNENWTLTAGSIYYLGYGGELTTILPLIGFIKKIGLAISPTTLILQIGNPKLL